MRFNSGDLTVAAIFDYVYYKINDKGELRIHMHNKFCALLQRFDQNSEVLYTDIFEE